MLRRAAKKEAVASSSYSFRSTVALPFDGPPHSDGLIACRSEERRNYEPVEGNCLEVGELQPAGPQAELLSENASSPTL